MDSKEIYEVAGGIAEALPEAHRESFAALMDELTRSPRGDRQRGRLGAVRRWLRDAGWIAR
jgi:hypothetical protein